MKTQIETFFSSIQNSKLSPYIEDIKKNLEDLLQKRRHGRWYEWEDLISTQIPSSSDFQDLSKMHFGKKDELSEEQYQNLQRALQEFIPWRKGPFTFFDLHIETEWRSDWKWNRIVNHIDLEDKTVLDVGCGSGYHCWRMWESGAKHVLGIDPTQIYYFQFLITKKIISNKAPVFFLPIGIEHIPKNTQAFDVVFSMGVLYHRKSPIEHLENLRSQLCKGGLLVLETLIVEGPLFHTFVPQDRYAQMRNVWFLKPHEKCVVFKKNILGNI